MNKVKYLLVLLSIAFITACGGSSSTEGTPASLSDIIGVWDFSENFGSYGQDEAYLVIQSSGASLVYDYQGDSYNNGANCYTQYESYHFTDLGNGRFELTDSDDTLTASITYTDTSMTIDYHGASFYTHQKTNLTESDLTPFCNSF